MSISVSVWVRVCECVCVCMCEWVCVSVCVCVCVCVHGQLPPPPISSVMESEGITHICPSNSFWVNCPITYELLKKGDVHKRAVIHSSDFDENPLKLKLRVCTLNPLYNCNLNMFWSTSKIIKTVPVSKYIYGPDCISHFEQTWESIQ